VIETHFLVGRSCNEGLFDVGQIGKLVLLCNILCIKNINGTISKCGDGCFFGSNELEDNFVNMYVCCIPVVVILYNNNFIVGCIKGLYLERTG
jgi:hypothetical protein